MTDNDLTLSRRQVLGGAATIGIAGALGAGTWAQLSDKEKATVSAAAGSIDLNVDGGDATYSFDFGDDLQNGDTIPKSVPLTNTGSLPGESLCFTSENFDDSGDNEDSDSEGDAEGGGTVDTDGELDDVATLTIEVVDSTNSKSYPVYNGSASGVESLATCANPEPALDGQSLDLNVTLDIPDTNINQAMGDSFSFDLVFTLYDIEKSSP